MGVSFFTPLSWNDAGFILTGVWNTVYISIIAIVLGSFLGMVIGFVRSVSNQVVNAALGGILDILRSVPLIIQLILFHTFIGAAGYPLDSFIAGSIVLALYAAAFMSEVFRSGFESVSQSSIIAARSLGLSYYQTLVHIHFPIGLRTVLQSWIGVALSVIKDSALVSVIGYMELLRTAEQLISRTQQPLTILIGVGLFYFLISYPLSYYGKHLEQKLQT